MAVPPTVTASRSIRGLMSSDSVQSNSLVIAGDAGRRQLQPPALTTRGDNGDPSSAFPLNACQGDCDTGKPLICNNRASMISRVIKHDLSHGLSLLLLIFV
jgi:hypothetical protein